MKNLSEQIKLVASNTNNEISVLISNSRIYEKKFPDDIKKGISSFKNGSKEISLAYFHFSASISHSIRNIEHELAKLSSIMCEADRQLDVAKILVCDDILMKYNELVRAMTDFLNNSERVIAENQNEPSLSRLYSLLTDFQKKAELFSNHLTSLNI